MRTKCGESRKGTASAVPQKSRRRRYLSAEGPGSPANSFAGVGDRSAGAAGTSELPSFARPKPNPPSQYRSEEHTSELRSLRHLVCRLQLEKARRGDRILISYIEHMPSDVGSDHPPNR